MAAILMAAALFARHQDVWFWREARPLVFGFLPIGLFSRRVHPRDPCADVGARAQALARAPRALFPRMIPAAVVFLYLATVLAIGLFARRASAGQPDAEDFFLAGRSLGPASFCSRCSAPT